MRNENACPVLYFLLNLADIYFGFGYRGKLIGIIIGFPGAIYTLYRQLKQNKLV
jgi:hypothetical protein